MTGKGPRLALVLGTRPEIIKLSPIINECLRRDIEFTVIHTGQHYSERLDRVFFNQLDLPKPDYQLEIGSDSHGKQTADMLREIETVLTREQPDITLVQGDTNSTLAGAIATAKLAPSLAHVEAGLRSFDDDMPEEINRTLADHAADFLFAPTVEAADQLRAEGVADEAITVTGNTIVDAVHAAEQLAEEKSTVLDRLDLEPDSYLLLTAHRAENVDDPDRFSTLLSAVGQLADKEHMEAIYPIHPRAREQLEGADIDVPDRIRLIDPQDFLDFLTLEKRAALVLTDSGGVQEETCILKTPCVTLRDNTERPETVTAGSNRIVGIDPKSVVPAAKRMMGTTTDWRVPFGEGNAAEQILETLDVAPQIGGERVK